LHSLPGLKGRRVVYLPSFRRAVVADGGGSVMSLDDAGPRASTRSRRSAARQVLGWRRPPLRRHSAWLAVISYAGRRLPDITAGTPGLASTPTGLQCVNAPQKSIVIVDRLKGTVVSITLKSAAANYPMALDEDTACS
jgi:hypothetical protein